MQPTESQRICIQETFGMPCAVVAGAGSGKTATLTNRIVYALEHPEASGVTDIDQILAITYTNKAAGELRSRIRSALQEAALRNPALAEQALKVDGAWISTIHGMCSRILKENALTLKLDPAFQILPDDLGAQMRNQAIESTLRQVANAPTVEALFNEYDRNTVIELIEELIEKAQGTGRLVPDCFLLPPKDNAVARGCLLELVEIARELYAASADSTGKTVEAWNDDILAALQKILGVHGREAVLAPLSPATQVRLLDMSAEEALATASLLPKIANVKVVKQASLSMTDESPVEAFASRAAALRLAVARPHLETLLWLAEEAQNRFNKLKNESGYLDNDDLLARTAKALRNPANQPIRNRYRDNFKLVMVDEFQDTNQMQVDMINLVAGGSAEALSPRMCVVGDAQQSIYRFRNADLAVFKDYVKRVEDAASGGEGEGEGPAAAGPAGASEGERAGGEGAAGAGRIVQLEQNFRSNAEILALSKGAFEDTFGRGEDYLELLHGRNEDFAAQRAPFLGATGTNVSAGGADGCADAAATTAAAPAGDSPAQAPTGANAPQNLPRRINVLALQRGKNTAGARECAARSIARDFRALADAGHQPGQMAVLLGGMTNAHIYANALKDQGLPCAIAGGSVFNRAPEVSVIVDLCFALVNPQETSRLVNVLTSPLFALEAGELLALEPVARGQEKARRGHLQDAFLSLARTGEWHGLRIPELAGEAGERPDPGMPAAAPAAAALPPRTAAALATLARAAAAVGTRPLSDLLDQVLADSGWLSRLTAENQTQAANALKAIRIVRGIEADQAATGLTLARLAEQRILTMKEAPGVLAAAGDNFVRIMTIHASKGLQFPIVAVAETDARPPLRSKLRTLAVGDRIQVALDVDKSLTRHNGPMTKDCLGKMADLLFRLGPDAKDGLDITAAQHGLNSGKPVEHWTAINDLNRLGDDQEYQRKLYVAYTRAEDCLIIVLNQGSDGLREGAPTYIAQLMTGEPQFAFDKATAHTVQMTHLTTRYPEHPEHDLEWVARVETAHAGAEGFAEYLADLRPYTAEDAPKPEGAAAAAPAPAADTPADPAASTPAPEPFAVPTAALPQAPATHPFGLQWSQGILSASAIKHEAEEDTRLTEPRGGLDQEDGFEEAPAPAPDKGTAFHALGEYAARAWERTGQIQVPPAERIQAAGRLHRLQPEQTQDLQTELERWCASPVAAAMARHAHLVPEAPFFVPLANADAQGNGALTLTGFIDLLAYNEFGKGAAHVVDYKTGRSLKTDQDRRASYEIQAQCYAYALLLQGFEEVELDFVFVDQPDPAAPLLPQVTHFPAPGQPAYTIQSLQESLESAARA